MRVLILDDESDESLSIRLLTDTLRDALDVEVLSARTVPEALDVLGAGRVDLVIADVFLPINSQNHEDLGRRARKFEEHYAHLGGLVLLDQLDRLTEPPKLLIHTACTDAALIELLDELGHERVRKPAAPDVLLGATLAALGMPSPG